MDAFEALRLTNRIYARLNNRRPDIETFESYYRGEQPLSFATAEWRKENAQRYSGFSDNWSAPVVNTEAERIRYRGITVPKFADAGAKLHEDWLRNEMDMQSSQGIITTLVTGRSFVIVWGDSDDEPVITWEHPSNVEIEYDWSNPNRRVAALKTWVDEKTEYATLYGPDELWKWQRPRQSVAQDGDSQAKQSKTGVADEGGWIMREVAGEAWPLAHDMGVVPVVEVQNRPTLLGDPLSEIQGVIPMQDFINLMWAYLMLASDYASMDARVVLGSGPPMIPIIDKDTGAKIGEKPVEMKELREKRLMYLTDPDAKIDSWKAAQLDQFTEIIDVAVGHISSQTRTPPTYLVSKVGMSNVNGEGLKAAEGPLNEKVEEWWLFGDVAFREINRLIALARGDKDLAQAVRLAKVNHVPPAMRSDSQIADMLVKKKAIGYPLEYLMELDGIDPLDVPRILEMKRKEDDANLQFAVQDAMSSGINPNGVAATVGANGESV